MGKLNFQTSSKHFTQGVQHIRRWEDAHLPVSQSRLAFDLFMLIAHSAESGAPLTLKQLFHSMRYSERGIRYVLEQFVAGGWCEITSHQEDKRSRQVMATDKLRIAVREYEAVVLVTYWHALLQAPDTVLS
jgi:DNA-binding MarR family transcriptional regulator